MTRATALAMMILASGPVLAEEPVVLAGDDILNRAAELEGQRVLVEDGRIFAAADESAGLKIGSAFLPLRAIASSDDLHFAWEHCGGIAPVDECRVSVTGTLVRNELGEPELHDVSIER